MPKIERPGTLTSQVVAYIREAVIRGEFEPERPLPEVRLAQELETARVTVRVALRALADLGLVEIVPHRGAFVSALTPRNAWEIFQDRIDYATGAYEALEGADGLVVVTEWNEFRFPDFDRVRALLKEPVIFDGRNVYDPEKMAEMGFAYYSMGRPAVSRAEVPTSTTR